MRLFAFGCIIAMTATGCASFFHLDEYSTDELSSSPSNGDAGSLETEDTGTSLAPEPAEGGLDQCASPTATLSNGCAKGNCVPFDNTARITGFSSDAGLPPLLDASPAATSDAASGSSADAGATDAGPDGSSSGLPNCSSLPAPVYVMGSGGLTSIAAELGALASTNPITLVYVTAHSCDGAKAIIANETAFATGAVTATYWDVAGTAHTCQLDATSQYADIGLGNVFANQCLSLPQGTSGVSDFLGPVTPGAVVVPSTSTQTSISAEALYYVVGVGNGAVAPWSSAGFTFENPSSGVQLDFGLDIGVPATRWLGVSVASATQNVTKIATSTAPEQTLGTMSTDLAESASTSSTIKELAYQDNGQPCGYYPNSTETSADKRNVRNGLYPIWGFTHMFAKVNAQGVPLNPNAATLIGYFTGNVPTLTGNFMKFIINDHLVPVCAMSVTRSAEMGRLSPFQPSPSCGCYFDSISVGSSSCQTCTTATDCPNAAPHCNLGYCETN